MPVFFAIYGLTYNMEQHDKRGWLTFHFVKQKLRRLMLPALIWALLYSIFSNFSFSAKNVLFVFFGSQASLKAASSLTSIWFLPCMFITVCFAEVIISWLYQIFKGKGNHKYILLALAVIMILFAFLAGQIPRLSHGWPWCINIVPMSVSYVFMGVILHEFNTKYPKACDNHWLLLLVFFISLILTIFVCKLNLRFISINNADMASANYGNVFLYLINSALGLLMMMSLSKLMEILIKQTALLTLLTYIGTQSLAIFLLHKPMIRYSCSSAKYHGFGEWYIPIVLSVVVTLLCALLAYFINRYLPWAIGSQKSKKLAQAEKG